MWLGVVVVLVVRVFFVVLLLLLVDGDDVDDVDHAMLGNIDLALHRFTSALKSMTFGKGTISLCNPWISGATGTLCKLFLKLDLSISGTTCYRVAYHHFIGSIYRLLYRPGIYTLYQGVIWSQRVPITFVRNWKKLNCFTHMSIVQGSPVGCLI